LPASKPPSPADWLRLEYAIEKPSHKLLAATEKEQDRVHSRSLELTFAAV